LNGLKQIPWWNRLSAHPDYDAFWQLQALDKLVVEKPASIPTLWLQGLWDQEDMYGAVHTWEALKAAGHAANNHLVMGPWCHSQVNRSAETLGPLKWKGDTAAEFRRDVLIPFFNTYLKDSTPAEAMAPEMISNRCRIWRHRSKPTEATAGGPGWCRTSAPWGRAPTC
jgi:predicted acyl esterase